MSLTMPIEQILFCNLFTICLILTMLFLSGTPAFAHNDISTENDPYMALKTITSLYVQNWVNQNYTEHYVLSDYKSQILSFDLQKNRMEAHILVEVNTTLKYNSVENLPYMQGVKELLNVDSIDNLINNPTEIEFAALNQINGIKLSNTQKINVVNKIREQYEDAAVCIGVATPLTIDFVLKADITNNNLSNVKLYIAPNGHLSPAEPFKTSENLKKHAKTTLLEYLSSEESQQSHVNGKSVVYNRVAARDYALNYTSNATGNCNCGAINKVNYNKWNNSVYPYENRFCHNDCADYVSQALVAGGFTTSTTWNRNTTNWTTVNNLCNYLVGLGAATVSDYNNTAAGHIIKMPGHVVMITLNDTVDHRFSAHTNDRLNATYGNSSSWVYYRVQSY